MSRQLFTSRSGGVSKPPFAERNLALHVGDDVNDVTINRARLAVEVGVSADRLFFMNQSHGSEIVEIDQMSDATDIRYCDAMITRSAGSALAVLVADCAPLLLLGERTSAAVHVGWRGLFGGIVEKVLAAMDSERFSAFIGPTICGKCYVVGDDLHSEASQRGYVVGKNTLDIPASIVGILRAAASNRLDHAEWNGICTFESANHYSYRREQTTGRQAGVVIHGS